MISAGIDVSKGKSMVCILKPYGEVVCSPFEVAHTEQELDALGQLLKRLSVVVRAISKEILTKRGLISISDYYQKVAHI